MENKHEELYQIISNVLGVEINKITPESHFAEDLNAGELEMEELAVAVKEKFNINLDGKASKIVTVQELIDFVYEEEFEE